MSKDLPAIPDKVDGELRRALVRMREELQALMGTRGSDPAIRLTQITGGAGGGALVFLPGAGAGGGADAPDLTPPPTPTFGSGDALGGISQVIVTWSGINYTQGHGNKQTIVYAVKKDPSDTSMPTFPGDAGIVAIAPHALTIIAIPSEPNTRWHIWLKFETNDGVLSTSPAGGTNGVQATTGQDVAHLLEVLTGKIRESQLYSSLGNRINLIDAADTVAGSVAARVKAETDARVTAIGAEATLRSTGDTNTLNTAKTYAETWAYSRTQADSAIATAGTALRAEFAAADTTTLNSAKAYAETWSYSRSQADAAIASTATTLRTEFNSADTTTLNAAKAYSESWAYSRTQADAAIAASASTLTTNFTSADSAVQTAAQSYTQNYAYSKSSVDSALASQATTLRAEFSAADGTTLTSAQTYVQAYAYAKATVDAAMSSQATTLRSEFAAADASTLSSAQTYTQGYSYAKSTGEALAGTVSTLNATVKAATLALPFDAWNLNGQSFATVSDGKVGSRVLRLFGIPGAYPNQGNFIPIDRTKKYRVRFWARPQSAAAGLLYFSLRQFTAANPSSVGPDNGGRSPYKPSGINRGQHNALFGTDQWGEYNYLWTASDWQAGVQFVQPDFLDNYSGASGWWEIQDFRMEEVTAFETLSATVQDVATAQADPTIGNAALASRTSTLESRVSSPSATPGNYAYNPTYAALQVEQSTRATLDANVRALYTVRAEVSAGGRTVVGGFGLAGTAGGAEGPRIDFGVRADTFFVEAPNSGGNPTSRLAPFVIRTSTSSEGGVSVPAGVYMDAAYIVNLTAMYARMASLVADSIATGQINAANMTLGDGTVGGNLKSTSYTGGSGSTPGTGWLLTPGGNVFLNNAIVYGTVYATNGVFSGSLSGASITGATGNFTGTLNGANITGATGTFSGSLNVSSGGSSRVEITTSRIKVFNGGVERVRIGDLS